MIKATNVTYSIDDSAILRAVDFEAREGQFVTIMGSNGAGKSTLLKLLAGDVMSSQGSVYFMDRPIDTFSLSSLARQRAVLSQNYNSALFMSVSDLVGYGRYPYAHDFTAKENAAVVNKMLDQMRLTPLKDREYSSLSGGEKQKAQMARVLAQVFRSGNDPVKALFLDEPTSDLDLKFERELLQSAKDFVAQRNVVVAVLHDLNLALHFSDRVYFLKRGEVNYVYNKIEPLDMRAIERIYDVSLDIATSVDRQFIYVK